MSGVEGLQAHGKASIAIANEVINQLGKGPESPSVTHHDVRRAALMASQIAIEYTIEEHAANAAVSSSDVNIKDDVTRPLIDSLFKDRERDDGSSELRIAERAWANPAVTTVLTYLSEKGLIDPSAIKQHIQREGES